MASGKSVQLYLVDGTPGGLIVAEIMNWTGMILACPRANLKSLLRREEVQGTGVYILLGHEPDDLSKPVAYVGETDSVKQRLLQHSKDIDKDFWERTITITNKDLNVTKAHVRYLEHRIIAKASEAKRVQLKNGNSAVMSALPEGSKSDMEQFLKEAELILPLLNVNILNQPPTITTSVLEDRAAPTRDQEPVLFECVIPTYQIRASAQEIDGDFVVLKGSEARVGFTNPNHSNSGVKERLSTNGTLVPSADETKLIFAQDWVFKSPSAAATVVTGRQANGWIEWKVQGTGQTYRSWQQSKLKSEIAGEDK